VVVFQGNHRDSVVVRHSLLVQHVGVEAVRLRLRHGLAAAADSVPVRAAVRRFRLADCVLNHFFFLPPTVL